MRRASVEKSTLQLQALEPELIQAVVAETGFVPSLARLVVLPIIAHLEKAYPGDRIYVASPKREYPIEDMREAMKATGSHEAVCARFGVSKTTLYRLLGAENGSDSQDVPKIGKSAA